ncbi:hypothetical protein [Streptomyces sp. NPDC046759]|uniref:hypothetical protein n=1 Tax=Streptomyces sp. NPDC046759 TaxID=3155019 RepID=UPI0033DB1E6C
MKSAADGATGEQVEPAAIPRLGTTWFDRGAGYWLRRIAHGCIQLALLLFVGLVVTAFYAGFWEAVGVPRSARTAVYAVTAVACLLSLLAGFVRTRRAPVEIPTPEQAWREHRSRQRRNAASAAGGRWTLLLLAPVLPATVAWAIGTWAAPTLARRTAAEIGAREDYERRVREQEERAEAARPLPPRNRAEPPRTPLSASRAGCPTRVHRRPVDPLAQPGVRRTLRTRSALCRSPAGRRPRADDLPRRPAITVNQWPYSAREHPGRTTQP